MTTTRQLYSSIVCILITAAVFWLGGQHTAIRAWLGHATPQQHKECAGKPLGTPCNDGLYCTVDDTCSSTGQCWGTSADCSHIDSETVVGYCDEDIKHCMPVPRDVVSATFETSNIVDDNFDGEIDNFRQEACSKDSDCKDAYAACDRRLHRCYYAGYSGDVNEDTPIRNDQRQICNGPNCPACTNDNGCNPGFVCIHSECLGGFCVAGTCTPLQ